MPSLQRVALNCTLTYISAGSLVPIANQLVTITNRQGQASTVYNTVSGGTAVSSVVTDASGNLNGSTNAYFVAEGSYIIAVPGTVNYSAFNVYFEGVHGDGVGNLDPALGVISTFTPLGGVLSGTLPNPTFSTSMAPLIVTSSGTVTVPATAGHAHFVLVGGGGGGAVGQGNSSVTNGGGGGGGGQYVDCISALVSVTSLTIIIGPGGPGGFSRNLGGSGGGSTTVTGTNFTTLTALGGGGGGIYLGNLTEGGSYSNGTNDSRITPTGLGSGGNGGTSSSSIVPTNGFSGIGVGSAGGGGGSYPGSGVNGGVGGNAAIGGGGAGGTTGAGSNATGYGNGGGGGAGSTVVDVVEVGGAGSPGIVLIEWLP